MVAAGTGGHIFPGLSLAQEIKKMNAKAEFVFFGTKNRLEAQIIPQEGYRLETLSAGKWKGSGVVARLLSMFGVLMGFIQSLWLSFREKPVCLISVGGYVSVPVALACAVRRIPLFLVEPNICAGMANRLLSKVARQAFCVPGSDALQKFSCPTSDTGVPIRAQFSPLTLNSQVKRILVLGGSQGAQALCEATLAIGSVLRKLLPGLEIVLQTGKANFENSQRRLSELGDLKEAIALKPFIESMGSTLAATDLIVARAGASTIAELSITGHPTIFVPFPHAADDHQRLNVKLLEQSRSAFYVEEKSSTFHASLLEAIEILSVRSGHFDERRQLNLNFLKWGRPFAGPQIAKEILSKIGT